MPSRHPRQHDLRSHGGGGVIDPVMVIDRLVDVWVETGITVLWSTQLR